MWLALHQLSKKATVLTEIYWLPLFRVLSEVGFEVVLVNSRDVKNISGKKTDEADAHWLMLLHTYGLLKSCFQPSNLNREIRNLVRHRGNLIIWCINVFWSSQGTIGSSNHTFKKEDAKTTDRIGNLWMTLIIKVADSCYKEASLRTNERKYYEVETGICEVWLHGRWGCATFAAVSPGAFLFSGGSKIFLGRKRFSPLVKLRFFCVT